MKKTLKELRAQVLAREADMKAATGRTALTRAIRRFNEAPQDLMRAEAERARRKAVRSCQAV